MNEILYQGANGFTSMLIGFTGGNMFLTFIIAAALIFFTFFSYKIYKTAMFIIGAVAGGVPSYMYLAPILAQAFEMYEPWFPLVVALVGAIVGIALISALQKLAVFIAGGALGYLVGGFVSAPIAMASGSEFLMSGPGTIVIPIVCALIVGVLSGKMFKPLFIVCTALVGALGASSLLSFSFGLGSVGMIVGILIAIAGIIFQFKGTKK